MNKLFLSVATAIVLLVAAPNVHAYHWMIRHGAAQCANCHADPAGGSLLTPYGRAQGEILLRMRYGSAPDHEPSALAEPFFGLLPMPNGLLIGGDARYANIRLKPGSSPTISRYILMQADLTAQYALGRVRANGSIGYVSEGGNGAAITRGTSADGKLISRVHWIGVDLGKHAEVLVRAGRMNIPFGLRTIEHTTFVRSETRTDINAAQSYGVAADYHRGALRAAAMFIAGNFQVAPDHFRSRGYAAFAEYAVTPTAALGVSSMATNSKLDLVYLTPAWRHAYGAFARWSPVRPLVVSAEWDLLFTSRPTPDSNSWGGVGMVQLDVEAMQGLHLGPTLEYGARDFAEPRSFGAWWSLWWFFLPHADARFDLVNRNVGTPNGSIRILTFVAQVHVYL